jgi:hypothetical protein
MKILKRTIIASGAVVRILIGIGAAAIVFVGLKKRKKRTTKH